MSRKRKTGGGPDRSGRPPAVGPRWLGEERGRRVKRLPVPRDLVGAVRFGNEHPDAVGPAFWQVVKEVMEGLIQGNAPDEAEDLRAILDENHDEVVLTYRLPTDSSGSSDP